MPSPGDLAAAGPWAVAVFFVASGIVGLWTGFQRGWIVTGREMKREEQRTRRLEVQVLRNTRAFETLAKAQAEMAEALHKLAARDDRRPLSARDDPQGFHD